MIQDLRNKNVVTDSTKIVFWGVIGLYRVWKPKLARDFGRARFKFRTPDVAVGGSPRSLFLRLIAENATHPTPTVVAKLRFWFKNKWNFRHQKTASCYELWLYKTRSLFYFKLEFYLMEFRIWFDFFFYSFERVWKKRKRKKEKLDAGCWKFQGYNGILNIWNWNASILIACLRRGETVPS